VTYRSVWGDGDVETLERGCTGCCGGPACRVECGGGAAEDRLGRTVDIGDPQPILGARHIDDQLSGGTRRQAGDRSCECPDGMACDTLRRQAVVENQAAVTRDATDDDDDLRGNGVAQRFALSTSEIGADGT
jgi:hypothetical protein